MADKKREVGEIDWTQEYPYQHCIRRNTPMSVLVHGHDYYEVLIMLSGTVTQIVNDEKMRLQTNEMLIMRPGDIHAALPNCVPEYLFSMQIYPNEMESFIKVYGLTELMAAKERQYVYRLSDMLANSIANDCSRLIGASSNAERRFLYKILLGKIMEGCLATYIHEDTPPWLAAALSKMSSPENVAEGVPALLRLCWMSHSQVCRLMKKYYGVTPQQYIQNLRMNVARTLVEGTNKDFETIAQEVGLSNMNHFNQVFKQKFGVSLSEMRHRSSLFREVRASEVLDD